MPGSLRVWREVVRYISVGRLLHWGAARELRRRGTRSESAAGLHTGSVVYYWRGFFEGDLRGMACEVVGIDPWICPNTHCRRLCGKEVQLRPVAWHSRSSWHVHMEDRPCGCRLPQRHVLSDRP